MRTKQLKINKNNHNNTIRDTQLRAPSASKDRSAKLMVPNGIIRLFLCLVVVGCFGAADVSALTYKSTVSPEFTIENAITIEVPSGGIVINDLVPGNAKESDEAIITIYSNNVGGYTLNASVGENTSSHNTTSLTNNNAVFNSIAFGSSLSALTDPGTWGYSYSADGTNWASYNGLPLYTDTKNVATLKDTTSSTAETGDTVKMKIAAYADSAQTAGTYDNVINFAAVGKAAAKDISTATYMQEVTSCPSTLTTGQVYTLKDSRDNTEYHVAKLADNNCWMLDNLALDPTAVTLDKLKGNTNASDTTLGYLKNGGGTSPYTATAVANKTSGFTQYDTPNINTASKTKEVTSYGSGNKQVGVYYNYCAASAGSWCYASGSPSSDPDTSTIQDVKEDICPSGWRMPTGSSSGEYQALYTAYSSNATNFKTALSTPLSGFFYNSSASNQGGYGYFWSSTYYDGSNMYRLSVNSSNVYPAYNLNRGYGNSVRCVAQ